jgi:hypothetical protein
LLPSEQAYVSLLNTHGVKLEQLSLQQLFLDCSKSVPAAQKFTNVDELTAVIIQKRVERIVNSNNWLVEAARQAFRSFVSNPREPVIGVV